MAEEIRPSRLSSIVFLVFVVFHLSAFVTVTIVQFLYVKDLEWKISDKKSKISGLISGCRDDGNLQQKRVIRSLNRLAEEDVEFKRLWEHVKKRQQSSVSDLIHQVLQVQQQQLISRCSGDVKICMPGLKGEQGSKGDQGILGNSGQKGLPGRKGNGGALGEKGNEGTTGPIGEKGIKGDLGLEGRTGQKGQKGDRGLRGDRGERGSKGTIGPAADKGEPGDPGTNGEKGTSGPKGIVGDKGDVGTVGLKGQVGEPGEQGPTAILSPEQAGCQCTRHIVFLDNTTHVSAHLGSKVILNCPTWSSPPATVTWYKKGDPVCYKNTITGTQLIINSLQPTDLGNFDCVASNSLESSDKHIIVTTTDSLNVMDCTFEADFCKWQQSKTDDGDWSISNGRASNSKPATDHTLGTDTGSFMYFDSVTASNQTSVIESFRVPADSVQCLTFWYNMDRNTAGTLSVYNKDCVGKQHRLFTVSGDQGAVWLQKGITIPAGPDGLQIVFEANSGSQSGAAIAIDDVTLRSGQCSSMPSFTGGNNVTVTLNKGNDTTLDCTALGSPNPAITWSKPSTCTTFDHTGSLYSIHNTGWGEGGHYICTATNTAGSITKDVYLNVQGSSFCDFEAKNKCGWTDEAASQIPWALHYGTTASSATGPSNDHTKGTGSGYYVYMETTGKLQGYTARFKSVLLPANTWACLMYWYNMNGEDIGSLNVYTKTCHGVENQLQTMSGNKGDVWKQSCVTIAPLEFEYNIIIEGVTGSSYHGDIGLDDIDISTSNGCSCAQSVHRKCTFENGLCGWTQDKASDIFDWTSGTGQTDTLYTGPDNDHTSGNGNYMYIETSNPRASGDYARLISNKLPGGQKYCLNFYYNMNGLNTGTLSVYMKTSDGSLQELFSRSGHQGQSWQHAVIDVPKQNSNFALVIEGKRGSSYTGDIAIDDVVINDQNCHGP